MSCSVGQRCGSDLTLLWLWCMLADSALIQLLAYEPPYATGVHKKKKKKKEKKKELNLLKSYHSENEFSNAEIPLPNT